MKLSKVLFGSALALSLVFGAIGCSSDDSGDGDLEGSKYDSTMTIDATSTGTPFTKDASTGAAFANGTDKYRRYWSQLGSSEKVAEITTTVTIDIGKSVYTDGAFVAGLVFDMNKDETEASKKALSIVGFNPFKDNTKAYVERYTGCEELKSLDTSLSALGTPDNSKSRDNGNWFAVTEGTHYKTDEIAKTVTFVVQLKQSTPGTYEVYMYAPGKSADSTTKIHSYAGSTKEEIKVNGQKTTAYATGAVGAYGNAGEGNKIVATYVTDKTSVTGSFFAKPVEE